MACKGDTVSRTSDGGQYIFFFFNDSMRSSEVKICLEVQLKSIGRDHLDCCMGKDSEAPSYLISSKDVFHGHQMGSKSALC